MDIFSACTESLSTFTVYTVIIKAMIDGALREILVENIFSKSNNLRLNVKDTFQHKKE